MIHHREKSEVRRFDIFKLIVLLILIALLLWFWLSPPAFVQGPDEGVEDTAVATETDNAATSSVADEPTEAETAEIIAPELESPVLSDGQEPGTVSLSGSGTPGSTVRIILDGAEVGTAEVGENGRWASDLDLEAGSRSLTLEALDTDGDVAHTVELPTFEVAAPAAALDIPTLNMLAGDAVGGTVNLTGTGTPGSEVAVVVDGELVGTATVDDGGTWSLDTQLPAGNYDVRLQALDLDGNVAGESDDIGLSLGELTLPEFDLPSFDFGEGDVEFSGVGAPGSTIELVANGEVMGTAVVADDGTWTIPATLEAGDYDFSLRLLDANGTLLAESEGRSTTVAVAAAEFVLPTFNLPDAALAGGDVTLTGTGTPGAELEIVVNGEVVGTAVVSDDGTWEFPTTLPAGDYELALRTVDGAGTAVETEPISLSLAEAATEAAGTSADDSEEAANEVTTLPADFCKDAEPGIDQGDTYIVARCEWLTKIANRLNISYASLIGVNPQIENPNLIFPGQVINLPPR